MQQTSLEYGNNKPMENYEVFQPLEKYWDKDNKVSTEFLTSLPFKWSLLKAFAAIIEC